MILRALVMFCVYWTAVQAAVLLAVLLHTLARRRSRVVMAAPDAPRLEPMEQRLRDHIAIELLIAETALKARARRPT